MALVRSFLTTFSQVSACGPILSSSDGLISSPAVLRAALWQVRQYCVKTSAGQVSCDKTACEKAAVVSVKKRPTRVSTDQ